MDAEDVFWFEQRARQKGYRLIAGVDDVGRGCCAGPVVCASVVLPADLYIPGLTDSKKVSKKKHEELSNEIQKRAISWGIGVVEAPDIDQMNIKQASRLAMKKAVLQMSQQPDYLLIDGTEIIDLPIAQESIVKGDAKSHSISAASIVAKYFRDQLMSTIDQTQYEGRYGWSKNAGYQSKEHLQAIRTFGITPHHRLTWKTIIDLAK